MLRERRPGPLCPALTPLSAASLSLPLYLVNASSSSSSASSSSASSSSSSKPVGCTIPALTGSSLWAETSHVYQGGMTQQDVRGPRRGRQERGGTRNTHAWGRHSPAEVKRLSLSPSSCLGRVTGWGGEKGQGRRRRGIKLTK